MLPRGFFLFVFVNLSKKKCINLRRSGKIPLFTYKYHNMYALFLQDKAYTNLIVSELLMKLILACNVSTSATCARAPTHVTLGFFWAAANPHPTARRGEVKKILLFFERGAPGGR